MEDKCPECKDKIELITIREHLPNTTSTGSLAYAGTITFNVPEYPATSKTYKCSNPKCWVTKIHVSWE